MFDILHHAGLGALSLIGAGAAGLAAYTVAAGPLNFLGLYEPQIRKGKYNEKEAFQGIAVSTSRFLWGAAAVVTAAVGGLAAVGYIVEALL